MSRIFVPVEIPGSGGRSVPILWRSAWPRFGRETPAAKPAERTRSASSSGARCGTEIASADGDPGHGHAVGRSSDRHRIELHIVLPPNLEASWEKHQIVVGFEVVRKGNRTLASALDANQTYRCSKIDREVLEFGREFAGGKLPGMTILDRDRFLQLIGVLVGHPRVTLARKTSVAISGERLLPYLTTEMLEDGRWKISTDTVESSGRLVRGIHLCVAVVRAAFAAGFAWIACGLFAACCANRSRFLPSRV